MELELTPPQPDEVVQALSELLTPSCTEPDGSDATFAFIVDAPSHWTVVSNVAPV